MRPSPITRLLGEVDRRWRPASATRTVLRILGASALLLQTDYDRATKDSDVLETSEEDKATEQLVALAGEGTPLARKHHVYIDPVAPGMPFLPQKPLWIPLLELTSALTHFGVYVLDVTDVVVSKVFRFSPTDRSDVDAMIARDLVDHAHFLTRFRSAVDWHGADAHGSRLRACVENLHVVERDFFDVDETEIELPPWIDED